MRCIFIAEKRGVYTLILETIHSPADVKRLTEKQTELLCLELRQFLVEQVSRTGGHLASNLGAVELTVAIHRVLIPPRTGWCSMWDTSATSTRR